MNALYLDDQGTAAGPYPITQIRELLAAGSLTYDTLASARAEGPWRPLGEFLAASAAAAPAAAPVAAAAPAPSMWAFPPTAEPDDSEFQTFVSRFLDGVTAFCVSPFWRGEETARIYSAYQDLLCRVGQYSLLACGVIMFFISGILAAKTNSGYPLIAGLGFAALMVIGHYLAVKFTSANRDLLRCDTANLNGDAVPYSVAVFSLLAVIGLVLIGFWGMVEQFNRNLTGALSFFVVSLLLAFLFFHAVVLSRECKALLHIDTKRGDVSAGETFLGVIKYWARLQLALSFVLLGAGGCTAALRLLIAGFFLAFSSNTQIADTSGFANAAMAMQMGESPIAAFFEALNGMGSSAVGDLILGSLQAEFIIIVPLAAYLIYLMLVFLIDVLAAVIRTGKNTERIP